MKNNLAVYSRKSFTGTLAGICMIIGASAGVAAPPATVPETYATVAIGDFPGMLDRVGELANKVKPGLSGELIRGQLGMMLGDEGLKSLEPGSGLVMAVPQSGRPFIILETAEGKAQTVADLLKQKGLMAETVTDNRVAVATNEESLNNAKGAMGTAAVGALEGNDDKFLMVTVDADKLIQDKGAQIQQMLKSLPQKAAESGDASSTAPAQMLSLVGGMITSVAKRTDVATIKVDISGEGVQFEKTLYPKGGVSLDEPSGPTGQELSKALPNPEDASMRYESYVDTQSAMKAVGPIIFEAMEAANVGSEARPELERIMTLAGEAFGDGFAGWVSFTGEKQDGIYLISVQDKDKAVQYMEQGISSMTTGSLSNLYSALGLETSATLTKNVATVDGQPAHRLSISMEGEGMEANPFMKMYNMENAMFTFLDDNRMLLALDGSKLEEAVKTVKAGSAAAADLKSRTELPEGGDVYIDYNVGFIGEAMAKENPELGDVFTSMKDTPILEAAYMDQESIKLMMVIPDEMVTKAAEGFQVIAKKAQEMRQDAMTETDSEQTTETE